MSYMDIDNLYKAQEILSFRSVFDYPPMMEECPKCGSEVEDQRK